MTRSKAKKATHEHPQPVKQASRPPAIRNDTDLRSHLWNVVEFAERGGQVDMRTNADLRNFISSPNSATIYEVLRLKHAIGETAPDKTSNQKYQLGDRIELTLIYKTIENEIIEKHTGIVWNITTGNNADSVVLMVNGKDGGAPYFVNLPVSEGAWWHPTAARDLTLTASALETSDAKEQATAFLHGWRQREGQRVHEFYDPTPAQPELSRR